MPLKTCQTAPGREVPVAEAAQEAEGARTPPFPAQPKTTGVQRLADNTKTKNVKRQES
eukprot:CAMPEP_0171100826 /NCGR_PEP_ID=MMETSP0766_2-20121228/53226_1 /TAXON_ID=439317 /ORGANISM="Gambierdiscus australes, Strain CAWD 149" /LENGTH=57 /DNA_ID=CAMNT_0011560725 /DNA_START=107 /DNA_END=277 /DNA_ORIENTATION=-